LGGGGKKEDYRYFKNKRIKYLQSI